MSGIFGLLNVNDTDRVFLSTLGQRIVADAVTQEFARYNAELQMAMGIFVEERTVDHTFRYKLPGGGRLQRIGGQAPTAAVKTTGSWDVAFPIESFGAQISTDRIDMAYMTVQDLNRHIDTLFMQDTNTVRFEMLKALFNNTARTFADPYKGSLTIQPLANGDTVVYPPVLGSETEAVESHYLYSGYASASMSDTNNPYKTIVAELEEHFGAMTGGSNIVAFINNAETAKTVALTEFNTVGDRYINPGANTDTVNTVPNVPGRILGRTDSGVWISEWRWVPANYILALHLDARAPLIQRIDPPETGLPADLALIVKDADYPIESSYYEHRFGVGVGNRLNGVVMFLDTGSSYAIPSAFA